MVADGSLEAHMSDQQNTLQMQLTTEVDKYLQERAEKREMNVNYFDGQHMATNTVNHQQIADVAEMGKDDIPELVSNDTGEKSDNNMEQYIQYNDRLETIPEESDEHLLVTVQDDGDEGDTIPYVQGSVMPYEYSDLSLWGYHTPWHFVYVSGLHNNHESAYIPLIYTFHHILS